MTITNGYATLAQIKALAKITSSDVTDDAVIEDMITQSSRLVDTMTGRTFYARAAETRYFDTPRGLTLELDDDLISITTLTNGDATTIAGTAYKLYPLNSSPKWKITLLASSNIQWQLDANGDSNGAISILGSWGYAAAAPADVTAAVEDIVVNAYHRRFGENTSGIATVTGAGVVITPKDIPEAAWRTINYYQRRA
jgi:hypothetical protein